MYKLTPEWDDDERMDFLFSDFKENRDVNTSDWDSKLDFWTDLILRSCRDRGSVSVSLQELNKTFRRKERSPLGLSTVLQSLSRCGKIQGESEFAANVDCGWLSWGVGLLLVKPLKWTWSTVLGSSQVPPGKPFVVIELVKEKATDLLRAYRSSACASSSILSFQELRPLCADVCADESTLCMALLQLQRDKQVTVFLHKGEKIVKFCQPGQDRVSSVSDVDVGIYQLERSEKLLGERVETLGLEADKLREEARMLLQQGKRSQALRCLKGRKRVEKRSDNLFAKLESIRGILDRITQSQTDKMVMQTYQAGVTALRLSLKDVTVERVENLVDQIQELCDAQDEVNQTLSSLSSTDDDQLEEELKSLLDESKRDSVSGLPEVPADHPSLPCHDLLGSLPPVPGSRLNVSSEQLEEELNRLTLKDSGVRQKKAASPAQRSEPAL